MMSTKVLIFFTCVLAVKVVNCYPFDCDHHHPEHDPFNVDEKWKRHHPDIPPPNDHTFNQIPYYGFANKPFEPAFPPRNIPYVPREPPKIPYVPPKTPFIPHGPPRFEPSPPFFPSAKFPPPPNRPPNSHPSYPPPSYPSPPPPRYFPPYQPHFPSQKPTQSPPVNFYPRPPFKTPVVTFTPPTSPPPPPEQSTPTQTLPPYQPPSPPETVTYAPATDIPPVDPNSGVGFGNTDQNGGGGFGNTDQNGGGGFINTDQNGGGGFSNTDQNGGGVFGNTDQNSGVFGNTNQNGGGFGDGQSVAGADPFGQTTESFANTGPSIFDGVTGNNEEAAAADGNTNSRGLSETEIQSVIDPRAKVGELSKNKVKTP